MSKRLRLDDGTLWPGDATRVGDVLCVAVPDTDNPAAPGKDNDHE